MKADALRALARKRQASRLDGYACIGDFQSGALECDHVSPLTKSGGNSDAAVMVVGQDWSSAEALQAAAPDGPEARLGYTPALATNRNLDALLERHFGLNRRACYLTNLFPFIKPGGISATIPMKHLVECAEEFTLPEIGIVGPRLVLCLGLRTFLALRRACGIGGALKLGPAIESPFEFGGALIGCVAHTGAWGMNGRGRAQVEADWAAHAARFNRP